jgi:hypothetical protein
MTPISTILRSIAFATAEILHEAAQRIEVANQYLFPVSDTPISYQRSQPQQPRLIEIEEEPQPSPVIDIECEVATEEAIDRDTLLSLTVVALRAIVKERGISGTSRMKKGDLVKAILASQE